MSSYSYIDIHKHGKASPISNDTLTILNVHEHFNEVSFETQCSMGIHPWYLNNIGEQYDALKNEAVQKNVIAIGECGLDHLRGAPMEQQIEAFEMQIQLANALRKPLIIHCVKAYPEIFSLLKKAFVPVVFHGFDKRLSIAKEVLQRGYYISFGAALLHTSSAAYQTFSEVPVERVFFETDDASVAIKEIYKAAAVIRKTHIDAIILQVLENCKTVFNL